MTLPRRRTAPLVILGMLALSGSALVGCTPETAPPPSPTTAFASEEEAFAAAEETYEQYVDASNAVKLDKPSTFQPVFELTSGEFEESDRELLSELHAEGYTLLGTVAVKSFRGVESVAPFDVVTAYVCVDVSASDLVDASGISVIPETRPPLNPLYVTFQMSGDRLLINHAKREENEGCSNN